MNDKPKTTAEQLIEMNQLVRWTLWKIATTDPGSDEPFRGYSVGEEATIQGHAQDLFSDQHWVAEVVGKFAAHNTADWAAFKEGIGG